jgi:hypothetical protein
MRKLFAAVCALALVIPSFVLAAYNDVTLTTSAVLSVGGYTLDVSGSSAAIQSITVNSGNFSVTLASGSSITISSPTLQELSSDVTSDVTSNTCNGSASSISLSYSGGGTITNTVTPSATLCSGSGSSGGSSPASGGGNGAPVGLNQCDWCRACSGRVRDFDSFLFNDRRFDCIDPEHFGTNCSNWARLRIPKKSCLPRHKPRRAEVTAIFERSRLRTRQKRSGLGVAGDRLFRFAYLHCAC